MSDLSRLLSGNLPNRTLTDSAGIEAAYNLEAVSRPEAGPDRAAPPAAGRSAASGAEAPIVAEMPGENQFYQDSFFISLISFKGSCTIFLQPMLVLSSLHRYRYLSSHVIMSTALHRAQKFHLNNLICTYVLPTNLSGFTNTI